MIPTLRHKLSFSSRNGIKSWLPDILRFITVGAWIIKTDIANYKVHSFNNKVQFINSDIVSLVMDTGKSLRSLSLLEGRLKQALNNNEFSYDNEMSKFSPEGRGCKSRLENDKPMVNPRYNQTNYNFKMDDSDIHKVRIYYRRDPFLILMFRKL